MSSESAQQETPEVSTLFGGDETTTSPPNVKIAEVQSVHDEEAGIAPVFPKKLGLKVVQVYVGKQTQPLIIHQDLITSSSEFFQKACNGNWKESEGLIRLPEQIPEVFVEYMSWLYSGVLDVSIDVHRDEEQKLRDFEKTFRDLCFLYVTGDMLQDRRFKNTVIDKLIAHVRRFSRYTIATLQDVLERTTPQSTLYRLVVDFWVWVSHSGWTYGEDTGSTTFWHAVVQGMAKVGQTRYSEPVVYPWVKDKCLYHEHDEGKNCDGDIAVTPSKSS